MANLARNESTKLVAHWISTIVNLHVAELHGPDGVDDLLHLVVDHAVQLTVPDSVSVDDDAGGEAVVVPVILLQCRWRHKYNRLS